MKKPKDINHQQWRSQSQDVSITPNPRQFERQSRTERSPAVTCHIERSRDISNIYQ